MSADNTTCHRSTKGCHLGSRLNVKDFAPRTLRFGSATAVLAWPLLCMVMAHQLLILQTLIVWQTTPQMRLQSVLHYCSLSSANVPARGKAAGCLAVSQTSDCIPGRVLVPTEWAAAMVLLICSSVIIGRFASDVPSDADSGELVQLALLVHW